MVDTRETSSDGTVDNWSWNIRISRDGAPNGDDTGAGLPLTGFQFYWLSTLLIIPIIRKFK